MDIKKEIKKAMEGQLRIWWVPQIGMDETFTRLAPELNTAVMMLDMLADYDQFQLDNNIKPDYSNMGGVEVFEDGEWLEWEKDGYDDPREYLDRPIYPSQL